MTAPLTTSLWGPGEPGPRLVRKQRQRDARRRNEARWATTTEPSAESSARAGDLAEGKRR